MKIKRDDALACVSDEEGLAQLLNVLTSAPTRHVDGVLRRVAHRERQYVSFLGRI